MALPPGFSRLIGVKINGAEINFPTDYPACVKTSEDKTYVPIRYLLEKGFTCRIPEPANNVYTFIFVIPDDVNSHTITTQISGSTITITYDGSNVDLKQFEFGGRIYIQLRAFINLIPTYELIWDKKDNFAIVNKKVIEKVNPSTNNDFPGHDEVKKLAENFQDQINDYTAKIWDNNKTGAVADRKFEPFFYGDTLGDKPKLRKDGLDITIVYGGATQTLIELNKYMNTKGNENTDASKAFDQFKFNTVRAIRSVFIRSLGQEFDASGNPIYEVYEFVARDIE